MKLSLSPLTEVIKKALPFGLAGSARLAKDPPALAAFIGEEPWCVDSLEIGDGFVEICGWAISPKEQNEDVAFCLNGEACHDVNYPLARPDIERAFWFLPRARMSGFSCKFPISGLFRDDMATFAYCWSRTGKPICSRQEV